MWRFRFETLLRIRRRREEVAAVELADSQAVCRRQEDLVRSLQTERRKQHSSLADLEGRGILARDLLLYKDYERGLMRRARREEERLSGLVAIRE
ncbi:MAG: hypothetical protein V2A77_06160 [Pseudomonadota bacterium]